jgi:formate dehydrogenase subunit beta
MHKTAAIEIGDQGLLGAIQAFMRAVLDLKEIDAVLVPRHLPAGGMVMPALVTDPDQLQGLDPLAPAFAFNTAKTVARLTRKAAGQKIAAMLRPCEIRAFVELVKLKQGRREDVILIGIDCLGALSNRDYMRLAKESSLPADAAFYQKAAADRGIAVEGVAAAPACRVCEHPIPEGVDLAILLFGADPTTQLPIEAQTEAGEALLERLALPAAPLPQQRSQIVDALVEERTSARDQMAAATQEATSDLEKLSAYLAGCVNCYNCRVACPVCYCRECVFVTDVFDHDPLQYLGWAKRRGSVKMPTDTLFYHLTRMAHMSTACVGCGQCSNACPNDVPVMELFRTVALRTQAAFGYTAGKDVNERPPLSEFKAQEFEEVVGIE